MSSYEELQKKYEETVAQRDAYAKEAEELKQQFLAAKQRDVLDRILNMSEEEKRYIIAHTEHSRSTCSDSNPCNGLFSASNGGYRCPKCMLMEILEGEHGGKYDFQLHFDIYEVTV